MSGLIENLKIITRINLLLCDPEALKVNVTETVKVFFAYPPPNVQLSR